MFAAGARKAESKGATVAPTARFDAAATKAPLAKAATDAQACKQSGGPTGKVTVTGTTFSRVTLDIPGQQQRFARVRAQRDAEERASRVIADHIRLRLASALVTGS